MIFEDLGQYRVEILGGQIMNRIVIKDDNEEAFIEKRVVTPKCINFDGTIASDLMPVEKVRADFDNNKLTRCGDIVIKLSTPFDAGIVGNDSEGCIVPSFCAVLRTENKVDRYYLLAFLNSEYCKRQMKNFSGGTVMSILSVGKLKQIKIPMPDIEDRQDIGEIFMETQKKLDVIRKIQKLEEKKNSIIFADLVGSNNEQE